MGTMIALVLKEKGPIEIPDQKMQRMGNLIAEVANGDKGNVAFVIAAGFARVALYDLMTGFGPTATFVPNQISTLTGRHLPDPERFVRLIEWIRENEARGNKRKAMAVIADAEFIKAFLRFYFSSIANAPLTASLNDFVSPDTVITIDTTSSAIKMLQTNGLT